MGQTVTYQRPDGQSVQAYLAEPASPRGAPGVVVIQEWWGLNDQIRGVADRYAKQGYRALVPDLYQDVRGAVQFLKAGGSAKVGVTGFCMGGALTLLAAVNVPEVDAAVVFYGYPPLEYVDASRIKAPLMGHWALHDVPFPIAGVDALEGKLQAAKVGYEFHRYDAQHAFFNETQVGEKKLLPVIEYEPAAAQLAWQRTLGFFERHLR